VVNDGLWEDIFVVIVEFEGMLGGQVEVITSKVSGRHNDLINLYGIYVSQKTTDMFRLSESQPGLFLIHDLLPGL